MKKMLHLIASLVTISLCAMDTEYSRTINDDLLLNQKISFLSVLAKLDYYDTQKIIKTMHECSQKNTAACTEFLNVIKKNNAVVNSRFQQAANAANEIDSLQKKQTEV